MSTAPQPRKRRPRNVIPFWVWSNYLHIGRRADGRDGRTILDFDVGMPPEERDIANDRLIWRGGPLREGEVAPLAAGLELDGPPDDCPWTVGEFFAVSDRLRGILEDAAPGNCQFLRITLTHDGRPCELVYWAMYSPAIDCADPARSGRSGDRLVDPFIVEDRVPPGVQVFRVVYDPASGSVGKEIYVRDALRRHLVREKVTGCLFHKPAKPCPQPPDVPIPGADDRSF